MLSTTHRTRSTGAEAEDEETEVRDIHALTPPAANPPSGRGRRRESWEASVGSETSSEGFTTMSREFNAMILAGSTLENNNNNNNSGGGGGGGDGGTGGANLGRIGEDEYQESNPLAIVPDTNPMRGDEPPPSRIDGGGGGCVVEEVSIPRVKKEEVESKISAWQTAKIAKINNRFKREDVVINGWENAQVEKATTLLKKIERKLDEQRAKAMEKMQNDVAKAHQKADEKRASAEAKRGTKTARVLELANLMRAVGRAPSKRSFF